MIRSQKSMSWLLLIGSIITLSFLAAFAIWYGSPQMESIAAIGTVDTSTQTQIYLIQDGSWVQGRGAEVFGNRIEITKGGSYVFTGTLEEGQIHVAAGENETVVLILAGMDINNTSKEAIKIEVAAQAEIVLQEGTENRVRSGEVKPITEETAEESESKGAIYADCDLNLQGTGSLQVQGYLNNGIHVTENLVIQSGTFQIEAVNHGIKGKSSITIQDGDFTILSGKDGIKSDRDTGQEYGWISLKGGAFQIESQGDGVQAETTLEITGGTYQVTAGGGSKNASKEPKEGENLPGFSEGERPEFKGEEPGFRKGQPELGENPPQPNSDKEPFNQENRKDFQQPMGLNGEAEEETAISTKGFKCNTQMNITGGSFLVDAEGDGLDSNGNISVEGGEIVIDGPTNDGNGAIDCGSESGGTCKISGGTVLAVGCSGMAETFGEASKQYSFCYNFSEFFESGEEIRIVDSKGELLYSHKADKIGNSIVFSCPKLAVGETYTLQVGEQSISIQLDGVSTLLGQQGSFPRGPGGRFDMPSGNRGDKGQRVEWNKE